MNQEQAFVILQDWIKDNDFTGYSPTGIIEQLIANDAITTKDLDNVKHAWECL